jgi:NAD(P)-dependent dehydrogenase (short-subunit alcohol dehydrogenase family)
MAIVTGTGGLGFETALALARAGAHVILAGRNPDKGREAIALIKNKAPSAHIAFEPLDLANLSSVADFAARLEKQPVVDLLVNNAGIMTPPRRQQTVDGFEAQFGVNYLGHFALTARLLGQLKRSSAARVVSVTSLAHRYGKINFDDLQSTRRYQPGAAYGQSKLAQALFTQELQRLSDRNGWRLRSMAAHPGIARTDLFDNAKARRLSLLSIAKLAVPLFGQAPAAGALPVLYAATSHDACGGQLYGPLGLIETKGAPGLRSFAPAALDVQVASRLRSTAQTLSGCRFVE